MSTGSPGWRDLKVRSELQDDALAGTVVRDYPAEVGKEKVQRFSEALKELHRDVLAYRPANEEESVEQEALSKKLECGLQIYDLILRDSQG